MGPNHFCGMGCHYEIQLYRLPVSGILLTNFGEVEDMVPKHRFKKLLEETVIKMNADASVKNDVAKKIIAQNLTQL